MTPAEALVLWRYVKACCPQQAMDEYTPDAWHDLLGDLPFADCRTAAAAVAKRQPFVAPSEIRAEVRRIRDDRLNRNPVPAPPAELLSRPLDYAAWLARETRKAASGDGTPRAIEGGAG